MARKTIRVDLPSGDPAAYVALLLAIVAQHKKLATDSPITAQVVDMTAFETRAKQAAALQAEIVELERQLQEKVGARDELLGLAPGQTSQSKGTLLFEVAQIRDLLLAVHRGNENALEPWGFKVVVGTAKSPGKTKTPPASGTN